jgi:hypothetical protein
MEAASGYPRRALITHRLAILLRVLGVLAPLAGCSSQGGDPLRVVPEEAPLVVVAPELHGLRRPLVAFLAGIQGASGFLDLIEARWGIDLTAAAGLDEAGIDAERPAALFQDGSAVSLAVGVSDPARFVELVALRAETLGAKAEEQGGVWMASAAAEPERGSSGWEMAFGVTEDRIGLLRVAFAPDADPANRWTTAAARHGNLRGSPRETEAAALGEAAPVLWASHLGGLPVPASAGTAAQLIKPWLAGLDRWSVQVGLTEADLAVRARAIWSGEGELPSAWLSPATEPAPFAQVFPKTTTMLVRGRLDAARVRGLASFVRDALLPDRFPDLDGLPLPSPAAVLDAMTGDVAVAILGVDADVSVTDLTNPKSYGPTSYGPKSHERMAAALQLVHTALAIGTRDPKAASALVETLAQQTAAMEGFAVAAIDRGGYRGYAIARGRHTYAVLVKDSVLLFMTGAGEVERFLAVGEGQGSPLATAAEDPGARAALGLEPSALGAFATLTRITRELAEKGIPPYFLKILNDIRSLSGFVQVQPRQLDLSLDVSL